MLTLSFGPYKGRPIDQVPEDYLLRLIRQPKLDATLREAVRAVLTIRELHRRRDELLAACRRLKKLVDEERDLYYRLAAECFSREDHLYDLRQEALDLGASIAHAQEFRRRLWEAKAPKPKLDAPKG